MSRLLQIAAGKDRTRGSVIFVHGLGGDPFTTWGGRTNGSRWIRRAVRSDASHFWPRWLARDIPGLAVYSLAYEAEPSELKGSAMSLLDRGQNVFALLRAEQALKDGPIAFVCHSLGGLVVKQLLRYASEQKDFDADAARLLDRVAQVVFIATPHTGSRLPIILQRWGILPWPTVVIKDLAAGDAYLDEFGSRYTTTVIPGCARLSIAFFGKQNKPPDTGTSGRKTMIVGVGSASPEVTGTQVTPVDFNHIDICKPPNRRSLVYKDTLELLERLPDAKPHFARSAAGAPQAPIVHLEVHRAPGFRGREEELAESKQPCG